MTRLVLLVLAGCGRIGFDALPPPTDGAGDSSDAPTCAFTPLQLTPFWSQPALATGPHGRMLAWAMPLGVGPLVQVVTSRVDAGGALVGSPVQLSSPGPANSPDIVQTAEGALVSFTTTSAGPDVIAARIDPSGAVLSRASVRDPVAATTVSSLTASVGSPGVVFSDARGGKLDMYLANLDASGAATLPDIDLLPGDPGGDVLQAAIFVNGEIVVTYFTNFELTIGRRGLDGARLGSDVDIVPVGFEDHGSIVWTGSEYLHAWTVNVVGGQELHIRRYDAALGVLGPDLVPVTTTSPQAIRYPVLAWSGTTVYLAWATTQPSSLSVYALDATGQLTATGGHLDSGTFDFQQLALAADDAGAILAWAEPNSGTYLAALCP